MGLIRKTRVTAASSAGAGDNAEDDNDMADNDMADGDIDGIADHDDPDFVQAHFRNIDDVPDSNSDED